MQASGDHPDRSRVVDRPLHIGLGQGGSSPWDLTVRGIDGESPDNLADDLDMLRLESREAMQEVVSKYNGMHWGKAWRIGVWGLEDWGLGLEGWKVGTL